jgi:hypothetical protein
MTTRGKGWLVAAVLLAAALVGGALGWWVGP